jgi:hypothetical protein
MASQAFAGWMRQPGRAWERVTEGADCDECLARLMEIADATPGAKDLALLPSGCDPNRQRVRHATTDGPTLAFVDAADARGAPAPAERS